MLARTCTALAAMLLALPATAVQRISLSADSIESPSFRLTKAVAQVRVDAQPSIAIEADQVRISARNTTIASPGLSCTPLVLRAGRIDCKSGVLRADKSTFPFSLVFDLNTSRFNLISDLEGGERWSVEGIAPRPASDEWQAVASIRKGQLKRFAGWLPDAQPKPTAGTLDATIQASGKGAGITSAQMAGKLGGVAFSDAAGLKAGEKLDLELKATATQSGTGALLQWSLAADYLAGEVFWQPIYVSKGGHRVTAEGTWLDGLLRVKTGNVSLAEIGRADFSGDVKIDPFSVVAADVKTTTLAMAPLFDTFVKPMFGQSMLGEATAQGSMTASASIRKGELANAQVTITDVSLADPRGRFAVTRLNTVIPWERGKTLNTRVTFDSALALNIPIGRVSFPLALDDNGVNVRRIALPVLDGRLEVRNFDLERIGEGEAASWTWRLDGRITPISVEALTTALKLPVMKGTLSGEIPNVIYARETLAVNGEIDIGVFGGKMSGRNITMLEPFGRAPRFLGDFSARNLDLELLTSTFSFGKMQGRIDADVKELELANWKPVKFDSSVRSSPGDYRKRISQQAVQNISALGGGGAAAAIQRSFLRIFEEFGYDKLGLTCRLNNGICAMGGVEEAPQGYVIVKGGGIPSLTVLGYNRNVSWDTLLARVQGIIAGNVKPTIQ